MAPRTRGPLAATGALLRALLGLTVLAALIGGLPYGLLTVGHPPTELGGLDALLQPDDGTMFLVLLTAIGWVAWAAFTVSVLIELIALARHRAAPRIKGLSGMQSLASVLVGGIVLLAPTAASATTPATAVAATHTPASTDSTSTPTPRTSTPASTDLPTHTVTSRTEAPWDVAEAYLGDGQRWKDIAALNPDIPELASGDAYLPHGVTLTLPPDARAPKSAGPDTGRPTEPAQDHRADASGKTSPEADAASDDVEHERHRVQAGETLSEIAAEHDTPGNWQALFKTNKGMPQQDGGHFDNPDLIYPGDELKLPRQERADKPAPDRDTTPAERPSNDEDTPKPEATDKTPDRATDQGDAAATPPPATPAPSQSAAPSPEKPAPQDTHSPDRAGTARKDDDQALAPAALFAGAGALSAALVGTLTVRRALQQRRRRPGRRIPMPHGRTAATEQSLRAAQLPGGFDLLTLALRSLALNLAAVGRDLPVIEAVVLHESKVELHLDQPVAPMKPFTAPTAGQQVWTCSASSPGLASEDALQDIDTPYPALVSLGWNPSGHLVLVDLDHLGILNLTGDTTHARHVLQAIAIELANTPLPGHLEVTTVADTAPGLDQAVPERVAHIETADAAETSLRHHTTDQQQALAAIGADSLRTARLTDDSVGEWSPHVLLALELPDDTRARLFDILTTSPRVSSAVITTSADDVPEHAWTLDCQGPDHTIVLPGSDIPVTLQGLTDEQFADAVELLTLAASDSDVEAPAWTRATDDETDETVHNDGLGAAEPVPAADDDAADDTAGSFQLPDEYADLEQEVLAADEADAEPEAPSIGKPAEPATAPPAIALTKPPEESTQEDRTRGESLADVLADDSDATTPDSGHTADDFTDPADVAHALTSLPSPCPMPAPSAISVTLPAQESESTDAEAESVHTASEAEPATEDSDSAPPAVEVLGPIKITGTTGRTDSSRTNVSVELITYLALTPHGVDHHAINDALWPGLPFNKKKQGPVITRARSWLGNDPNGDPYFPRVHTTGDSRYHLSPAVSCDWTTFQRLARTGLTRHDATGTDALRQALEFVRGRPFTGINPQRYAWAEPHIQEMVSAIVDVAYELSTRRREDGDLTGALWAARRGLLAAEENELLHRQLFLAHHAAGDIDALRDAAARLAHINERLLGGVDMEAETAELLRNLLPRPISRTR